jgi:phosphoribosylglycinamide formyltransferase 1
LHYLQSAGTQQPLKLSGPTLAGIYLGKIKTWQDPEVKKGNPGVTPPGHTIVVAHRSDGSGTANIFSTYLAKISPEWGKTARQGNFCKGVTGTVKQTLGAIGYVELTYAKENNLPVAQIRNQAAKYVDPSAAATTAAINAFSDELGKDVRTPIVDPPASAAHAYPICGLTYLLVPKQGKDPKKHDMVKQFIQFILTDGQNTAECLYYAKLPPNLADEGQKMLGEVRAAGGFYPARSLNYDGERVLTHNISILLSGRGSNFEAIAKNVASGKIPNAQIAVVISNRPNAGGLAVAERLGLKALVIASNGKKREEHDQEVVAALKAHKVDLVCLAGYMRLLSPWFVQQFPRRILNIHPSLLPAFPGLEAQEQAFVYGVKVAGCTVHFVDEELDHGPIIVQKAIPVLDSDDERSLAARILEQEHIAYSEAIEFVLAGNFEVVGRRVVGRR